MAETVNQNKVSSQRRLVLTYRELGWSIIVAFLVSIAAWLGARSMDRIYRADTTLVVVQDDDSSISSLSGQLGGVASLIGGVTGGGASVKEALATLRSRYIIYKFLEAPGRLDEVSAVLWKNGSPPADLELRRIRAASYLRERVIAATYDQQNGTFRVSFTWPEREQAALWANEFVAQTNGLMRNRVIEDTKKRLKFLQDAARDSDSVSLRDAIFRLIESQLRSQMFAATKPDYALRIIDPAVVPPLDAYVRPQKALIALASGFIALMISVAVFLLSRSFKDDGPRE